jgi:hypothetical protein
MRILLLLLLVIAGSILAEQKQGDDRLKMEHEFGLLPTPSLLDLDEGAMGRKSVPKALLFSLLVPGTGELYSGSDSGYFFLTADIALWGAYFIYHKKGIDREKDYRKYGDRHWNLDRFKEMAEAEGDYDALARLSELPSQRDRKFYDMIGEEDDFRYGWDSDKSRQDFKGMLEDSKNSLKAASICMGVSIANHIISSVNAFRATKKHNRNIEKKALNIRLEPYISFDRSELKLRIDF